MHCIAFVVIFFLKEWITTGSTEIILDFIKAVQTRSILYIIYTYQRGTWPCIFIGKCEASFSIVNINPDLYSIFQMNHCWPQADTKYTKLRASFECSCSYLCNSFIHCVIISLAVSQWPIVRTQSMLETRMLAQFRKGVSAVININARLMDLTVTTTSFHPLCFDELSHVCLNQRVS